MPLQLDCILAGLLRLAAYNGATFRDRPRARSLRSGCNVACRIRFIRPLQKRLQPTRRSLRFSAPIAARPQTSAHFRAKKNLIRCAKMLKRPNRPAHTESETADHHGEAQPPTYACGSCLRGWRRDDGSRRCQLALARPAPAAEIRSDSTFCRRRSGLGLFQGAVSYKFALHRHERDVAHLASRAGCQGNQPIPREIGSQSIGLSWRGSRRDHGSTGSGGAISWRSRRGERCPYRQHHDGDCSHLRGTATQGRAGNPDNNPRLLRHARVAAIGRAAQRYAGSVHFTL